MKDICLLPKAFRVARFPLLCAALCVLAAHLPMPAAGQGVYATPYTLTTLAGQFSGPAAVAVDSAGNIYVADSDSFTIRKVTPAGVVTILAGLVNHNGTIDGTGTNAQFYDPRALALDTAGNLYVADNGIRKVTPAGVVTTLTTATTANGLAVDGAGNIYLSIEDETIRELSPVGTNWVLTTIAGQSGSYGTNDGIGSNARFGDDLTGPGGLALDSATNLYVTDGLNATIRKLTLSGTNWVVTTFAGGADIHGFTDGVGLAARFDLPSGLAVDGAGNLYVTDENTSQKPYGNVVRKVTPAGVVTTLVGTPYSLGSVDGTGAHGTFFTPVAVAVDSVNNIYVTDWRSLLRKGVLASSVPAPVLQPPGLNAGQFGFGITGVSGLAVDILSSSNLVQWQVVTNCTLVGGTNFCVPPAPAQGSRFYRARVH